MGLTDAALIGLCLDTGHVVLSGSDPVDVAHRHADRLALAHWKDASGAFQGSPIIDAEIFVKHREFFRSVGNGAVDWRGLTAELNDTGFQECILLELDAAPDPEAALIAARTYLENTLREALPSFVPSTAAPTPAAPIPLTSQD
jgi:inosose dehydratase